MENQLVSQMAPNIHSLKHQLQKEQQLFNSLKKSNSCFAELKEVHLRIKQIEQKIEQVSNATSNAKPNC